VAFLALMIGTPSSTPAQDLDDPSGFSAEPVVGDCSSDATTLALQAEDLLADGGPDPTPEVLERARQLYRRARLLNPSPLYALRAADLAAAAADEEEAVDLLSDAAERGPELLAPAERLLLARRAEERRDFAGAIAHTEDLREALSASGPAPAWIEERLRHLEVEAEAQALSGPVSAPPSPEARLALADARRLMSRGELPQARRKLLLALRRAPGYTEAALALGALETRESRAREAIRAYRAALSSDPSRLEALVALASLLWDEPDRAAKEESLALLDRAVAERPDLGSLLRLSASRWAEWGDAHRALERLEAFRANASPNELRETEVLYGSLKRRAAERPHASGPEGAGGADLPDISSPAVAEWRKAQVYFRRGDPASLAAALESLIRAERLDPSFSRAPELAAAIHEKRGETRAAEMALSRAILADPSRAASHERLALLLMRQPDRAGEAEEAWQRAEEAGSQEALFYLASSADRAGKHSLARSLFRRYLDASPGGVHAAEASAAAARLEARARVMTWAALGALGVLALAAASALHRHQGGLTLQEWLARAPDRAREARPIVGRIRHEAIKHGGLLLRDGAERLRVSAAGRQETASLLSSRLFGWDDSRGLLAQSFQALRELEDLARESGHRLNLRYRDPLLAPLYRGLRLASRTKRDLRRIADSVSGSSEGESARAASRLERAAAAFSASSGVLLDKVLDAASETSVRFEDFARLLGRVASENGIAAPPITPLGLFRDPYPGSFSVRVPPADWEIIWRNLFANALEAGSGERSEGLRLALSAERSRDAVTGEALARFVLADNLAAALTPEMVRGRAADRGWGVVADLVRKNGGAVDVGPAPDPSTRKGIVLEFPALEAS
jgi:Tfp pilus assembly protein PilF